jgi:two-component system sensor histidine kinase KdpD
VFLRPARGGAPRSGLHGHDLHRRIRNIALAEALGATVVRVKADKPAEGLIAFARREGITHVVFGQSQRSRWQLLLHGSVIDRFLTEVPDATVQVVPVRA